MKKALLITLIVLVVLAGTLSLGFYFLTRTEKAQQLVSEKAVPALEWALEAKVSVGRLSGTLTGGLEWRDIKIVWPELTLTIDRAVFWVDFLALTKRHFRITRLVADNPKAVLTIDPKTMEGLGPRWSGAEPAAEKSTAAPAEADKSPAPAEPATAPIGDPAEEWRVSIDNISLSGGRFDGVRELTGPFRVGAMQDLSGGGSLAYGPTWDITARLSGRLSLTDQPCRVDIKAGMKGLTVTADDVALAFGPDHRSRIDLKGDIKVDDVTGRANYRASVHPADVKHLLGPGGLPARAEVNGRVEGGLDRLKALGRGRIGRTGLDLRAEVTPPDGKFKITGRVDRLNPAQWSALAKTKLPAGQTDIDLDLTGSPQGPLKGRFKLDRPSLDGLATAAAGRAELEYHQGRLSGWAEVDDGATDLVRVGRLRVDGELTGRTARAEAKFTNAVGFQTRANQGRFNLTWREDHLTVENFHIREGDGTLGGRAELTLAGDGNIKTGQIDLDLAQFKPPTSYILKQLGVNIPLAGLFSIRLTGPLQATWPGDGLKMSTDKLNLTSDWGRITATGRVDTDRGGRLKDWLVNLDLTDFRPPDWILSLAPEEWREAILNGRVILEGVGPQAGFQLDLGGSVIRGRQVRRLIGHGQAGPDFVRFENLEFDYAGAAVVTSGRVWPDIDLSAQVEGRDLARALSLTDQAPPMEADVYSFTGRIFGSDDGKTSLDGRVSLTKARWQTVTAGQITAQVAVPDLSRLWGRVDVRAAELRLFPNRPLEIRANLVGGPDGLSGHLSGHGRHGGLETDFILKRGPTGLYRADVPSLAITAKLPLGVEVWRSTRPAAAEFDFKGIQMIDLDLAGPTDQHLTARLQIDRAGVRGQIELNRLELAAVAVATGGWPVSGGQASGSVKISGPLAAPRLDLDGQIDRLFVAKNEVDHLFISGRLDNGLFQGQAEFDLDGVKVGRLTANLPVELSFSPLKVRSDLDHLRAKVSLDDFPVGFFGPALKGVTDLAGTIKGDVELSPTASGRLAVEKIKATLAATGQTAEEGRADLTVQGRRLTLRQLTFKTGGGSVKAQGSAELASPGHIQVRAEFDPADFLLGPYGSIQLAGWTELKGTIDRPVLTGDVKIHRLSFKVPPKAPPESQEIKLVDPVINKPPPLAVVTAGPKNLAADLKVAFADRAVVNGEGLNAVMGGGVTIAKKPGGPPRLTGLVSVISGRVTRFGRRFNLEFGEIKFTGAYPPEPTVSARAATRVSKVDISLGVSGPLTGPELDFASQPAYSKEDIMSYLLFGRPASGLSENESVAMEAQAVSALGGPASEILRDLLDEQLTPDVFSVSSSAEGGVSVEAGKQILPDLYLSYEAFSEPSKPNEIHLEYRVTPNISLESTMGDEKTTGVDVYFNFDF